MRHESQFFILKKKCNIIAINSCFETWFSSSVVFPHNAIFIALTLFGVGRCPLRFYQAVVCCGERESHFSQHCCSLHLIPVKSGASSGWLMLATGTRHTHTSHTNTLTHAQEAILFPLTLTVGGWRHTPNTYVALFNCWVKPCVGVCKRCLFPSQLGSLALLTVRWRKQQHNDTPRYKI